jgi:hypothetical protein
MRYFRIVLAGRPKNVRGASRTRAGLGSVAGLFGRMDPLARTKSLEFRFDISTVCSC